MHDCLSRLIKGTVVYSNIRKQLFPPAELTYFALNDVYKNILMCQYEELVVNNSGYVIRCPQCQHFQVFFGGIVLSLSKKEFFKMQQELYSVPFQQQELLKETPKSVLVATPKQGVHLWLSLGEIHQLSQLLDDAHTEVQTQELFALSQ